MPFKNQFADARFTYKPDPKEKILMKPLSKLKLSNSSLNMHPSIKPNVLPYNAVISTIANHLVKFSKLESLNCMLQKLIETVIIGYIINMSVELSQHAK